MIRILAKIRLDDRRKVPFGSDYRPLFKFHDETRTSGAITLLDRELFYPNSEGLVEIEFAEAEFLGQHFGVGSTFTFGESLSPIGEGVVEKILP